MSDIATRTPQQQLVAAVRDDTFKQQVAAVLPPSVTLDRFVRIAATAAMTNPQIAEIRDQNSILRAFVQSAAVGLMPDGVEAAIVKRGDQATFTPMIAGFRKIAAEHGWNLRTGVVFENDFFEHSDEPQAIVHRKAAPGQRGERRIAAWAVNEHRDGRRIQVVLYPDDVEARRAMATTKAVWDKWTDSMWEKSAGRAVFKKTPLAESDSERARIERLVSSFTEDPAAVLYGERRQELPAGAGSNHDSGTATPTRGERPTATPEPTQQADDPAGGSALVPAAASSAPGDDEPVVDAETPEQVQQAAEIASTFVIPNGQNKDKTLAEIHASGDKGVGWIRWALRNIGWPSPETERDQLYRDAVWAFARVYAADLYQAVLAEKQAEGLA